MKRGYIVLGLTTGANTVQPLAWAERRFSKREGRRLTGRFRRDRDVFGWCQMHWSNLYHDPIEMMEDLPKVQ